VVQCSQNKQETGATQLNKFRQQWMEKNERIQINLSFTFYFQQFFMDQDEVHDT
jgi:hypothetical protein